MTWLKILDCAYLLSTLLVVQVSGGAEPSAVEIPP